MSHCLGRSCSKGISSLRCQYCFYTGTFPGYYSGYCIQTAITQLFLLHVSSQPLSTALVNEHMPKKELLPLPEPRKRTQSRGLLWFTWRKPADEEHKEEKTEASAEVKFDDLTFQHIFFSNIFFSSVTKFVSLCRLIHLFSCRVSAQPAPDTVEVTAAETQTMLPGTPIRSGPDSEAEEDLPYNALAYKKSLRLTTEQIVRIHTNPHEQRFVFKIIIIIITWCGWDKL